MVTKLQSLLQPSPRSVEPHDVFAAFLRVARAQWGERMAVEPFRYARGTLTVRCPSPLWRVEMLFRVDELTRALTRDVPGISLHCITAILA